MEQFIKFMHQMSIACVKKEEEGKGANESDLCIGEESHL